MKTKFKLLFVALLTLGIQIISHAQCGGPINYVSIQGGGSVLFMDSANYNMNVNWNFGDGDTANNNSFTVSHTYSHSGTYAVCITVTDTPTCTTPSTYCDTVVINLCQGISAFNVTQTGFGAYAFYNGNLNLSTGTWYWNFGDGDTSTAASPTHNYASSGNFTVTLFMNDTTTGCIDTSTQNLSVSLCSFASNFSFDSLGTAPFYFVVVSPVPGYTYTWHFGDGTTGTGDSVTHQYGHYGNYTFCLFTSDNVTGCSDSTCNSDWIDPCGIYAGIEESTNGLLASFGVGFNWQNQNNQSGLTYAWGFPGAVPATSAISSPTVTYSTTGTYTATLLITNAAQCADTISQQVAIISAISSYNISGTVTDGGNGACATIYLIVQDTIGHLALLDSIVEIDTVNGCSGQYAFGPVPVDTYYVKAALNSNDPNYANYLPTYYSSALHWSGATPVILSNANATADFALTAGNNPGGPGFVSGWISQGAGLVLQQHGGNLTRGAGDLLAGVQVNLLTSNNDPVGYTYSDANGHFSFSNLAYNSYQIYVERLNVAVEPDTFTLSAQNPGDTTIAITVDSTIATSINNLSGISVSGIFPNPVSTVLDVEISSKLPADATLSLNDVLGQTVAVQKLHLVNGLNKGEINMAGLAPGVYQVVVQSNNERLTYKVVKAK